MAAPPPHVCAPLLQLSHTGVVFHCGDGSALSGAQVRDRVAGWAHTLCTGFALRPGEVVALAAGTTADFIHAWLALTAVGGVAALLNTKWCVQASCFYACPRCCVYSLTA
jgi:acyl-CoA synthetase (AMP-forming)/AMP-acid ligase II